MALASVLPFFFLFFFFLLENTTGGRETASSASIFFSFFFFFSCWRKTNILYIVRQFRAHTRVHTLISTREPSQHPQSSNLVWDHSNRVLIVVLCVCESWRWKVRFPAKWFAHYFIIQCDAAIITPVWASSCPVSTCYYHAHLSCSPMAHCGWEKIVSYCCCKGWQAGVEGALRSVWRGGWFSCVQNTKGKGYRKVCAWGRNKGEL